MISPVHGTVTAFTGNLSGAMLLEALGGFILALVAAYALYKLLAFMFDTLDRTSEYAEQSNRNRAYIKLMVTAIQAGILKQVAIDEKIDLDAEINAIPTEEGNPIGKQIKDKLLKDVRNFE